MTVPNPYERFVLNESSDMNISELKLHGEALTNQLNTLEFGTIDYAAVFTRLMLTLECYDGKIRKLNNPRKV